MAILDGKHVADEVIDPGKHRYTGMWRPPSSRDQRICQCGDTLWAVGSDLPHWQAGHFDEAQYVTIDNSEKPAREG